MSNSKPDKPSITPEFIAQQRAIKEAKKKAKKEQAQQQQQQQQQQDEVFNTSFIKREMLKLDHVSYENGMNFTIMSYNALAQCLIRRELFPENGKQTLKWKNRGVVLLNEIEYYLPDVLCMQEVDRDKLDTFWHEEFMKRGMDSIFKSVDGKNHGCLIAWNTKLFELEDDQVIYYDEIETPGAPKQRDTKNSGMLIKLKVLDELCQTSGIVIGTTHMFWHPKGSYERTRQLAVFIKEAVNYSPKDYPIFLAGDYNSECFDTPYLCATNKPAKLDPAGLEILTESQQNFDPEADDSTITNRLQALIDTFNNTPYEAMSMYKYYKLVHPTNVHTKGDGEPIFSNWAHVWRGLLDYIFVLKSVNDTPLQDDELKSGVKLLELLRMPEPHEMGQEPSGQPREGMYPSDHLALMAKVSII